MSKFDEMLGDQEVFEKLIRIFQDGFVSGASTLMALTSGDEPIDPEDAREMASKILLVSMQDPDFMDAMEVIVQAQFLDVETPIQAGPK